ncbi:BREX-2 system adenine-specific DNA-methyltransferase PglX [Streptomyces virginiae]
MTHVIDTSGAYIPGHGTPTVILVGRNYVPRQEDPVRAVLGVRGEPQRPDNAAQGLVWNAILHQLDKPGSDSAWITVEDMVRNRLSTHPWSLSGGGARALAAHIVSSSSRKLSTLLSSAGITSVTGEDDLFLLPANGAARRLRVTSTRPMIIGDTVRDFRATSNLDSIWVYGDDFKALPFHEIGSTAELLAPYRAAISQRKRFGTSMLERGMSWHEWQEIYPNKLNTSLSITFASVSTHNNFALDRGGNIFKQSAPVLKLKEEATEEEYQELLGLFSSSTGCFWLKQVCHDKGNRGEGGGITSAGWERFFDFTATKLEEFPLPARLPRALGRTLDTLAQELSAHEPSAICAAGPDGPPTRARLDAARDVWTLTREQMISLQEELDWEVYHSYGLLTDVEKARLTVPSPSPTTIPRVKLGERAFEIVLARKQAAGQLATAWFDRHGSTPVTEIPSHWPDWYKEIVQARIDTIAARRDLALIERPECKRRWAADPWEKREKAALRTWLLDRCEDRSLWFAYRDGYEQPRTLTVGQLADELEKRPDADAVLSTARLYATHLGKPNLPLTQVLEDVTDAEHVPYLAAYRYKDTGLRKRAQWERTWELQRKEDNEGVELDIAVPPKYASADFTKTSYWSNRGKLDVPKERFVSYPDANPDSDPTLLLGWAGWDHRDQATALMNIVDDRRNGLAWEGGRLVPLLAGIAELMPWLRQWFGDVHAEWSDEPIPREVQSYLESELAREQLAPDVLSDWRPVKKTRARKTTKTAAAAATETTKATADDE